MCNLFQGWTVGPIHSSTSVSLHIMRSAHCCSNENNDPLLAFQGFAISSFFFFFPCRQGSRFKQTAPVLIRSHRECLLPVFTGMANCGSAHNVVLCYCGSWTPNALEYTGFPSVIKWAYIPCSAAVAPLYLCGPIFWCQVQQSQQKRRMPGKNAT